MKALSVLITLLLGSSVQALALAGNELTLDQIVAGIDREEAFEENSGLIFPATSAYGSIFDGISDVSKNCKNHFHLKNNSEIYCYPYGNEQKAFLIAKLIGSGSEDQFQGPVLIFKIQWATDVAKLESTTVYGTTLYKLLINP